MKLLSEETEVHCQALLQATEALKASKGFCRKIQAQLQHKKQQIKHVTAVKDYRYVLFCAHTCVCLAPCVGDFVTFLCLRIKQLEDKLKSTETKRKKEEDYHIKK